LLLGPDITRDKELLKIIEEKMEVSILQDLSQLEMIAQAQDVDLAVVELTKAWENDLSAVLSLKTSFPQVLFIVVNGGGDREVVIRSFRSGANDFFKKPYNPRLLAERVEALVKTKITK
jgi:DNA-binding response OmpR family regulator